MRFKWDQKKNKILMADRRRGIGLEKITQLFSQPYYLDQKNDDPEQFRAIGYVGTRMITLIFEQREDEIGSYYHLITYWPSTKTERTLYEEG